MQLDKNSQIQEAKYNYEKFCNERLKFVFK